MWTIGYGAKGLDDLVAVLLNLGTRFLVDVRSAPYSRHRPEFNREVLDGRLRAHGIRYVFMGDQLGGRPADAAAYTEGRVDYAKAETLERYREGIARLVDADRQGLSVVLMCSEGRPEDCHRSKLIGRTLAGLGIELLHVEPDGSLAPQAAVMQRVLGATPPLFPDLVNLRSRGTYVDTESGGDE